MKKIKQIVTDFCNFSSLRKFCLDLGSLGLMP